MVARRWMHGFSCFCLAVSALILVGCESPDLQSDGSDAAQPADETPTVSPEASTTEKSSAKKEEKPAALIPALAWKSDPIPVETSEYQSEPLEKSLKLGPVDAQSGVEVQHLDFVLPPGDLCLWSPDGQVFYTSYGAGIVRIDVTNWRITHQIKFTQPLAPLTGLTLTSEGLVASVRKVVTAQPIPGSNGQATIEIDLRTGEPREYESIRKLVVLDPANLQVVRQFTGPAKFVAGSPQSPFVCVSDHSSVVKLVDIRSGKVLDTAGRSPKQSSATTEKQMVFGFDEIRISPDGKTLYHCSVGRNIVHRVDIASGKFVARDPIEPSGSSPEIIAPNLSMMQLSPDGKLLAFRINKGYSLCETEPEMEPETEIPPRANQSTAFAFVGSGHRLVANSVLRSSQGGLFGQSPDRGKVVFRSFDLTLLKPGQLGTGFQIYDKPDFQRAMMNGSPVSDHVLVNSGTGETAWVKLPPDDRPQKALPGIELKPIAVRGFTPDKPLVFVTEKSNGRRAESGFPAVAAPYEVSIACSADGSRLYMIGKGGTLSVFDTNTLREVRRAEFGDSPESYFQMQMTQSGPLLISQDNEPRYMLVDGETLDGQHALLFDKEDIWSGVITSPGANAAALVSREGDLEVVDVRDGRLIGRVTTKQLARFEQSEARKTSRKKRVGQLAMSHDGTVLMCRYRAWHALDLSSIKLTPLGGMAAPRESGPRTKFGVCPLPSLGLCYLFGRGIQVFDFPGFADTGQNLEVTAEDIIAFGPGGHVYARRPSTRREPADLRVYDAKGNLVFRSRKFKSQLSSNEIAPLPHQPGRVFVEIDGKIRLLDLKPESKEDS